MTKWSLKKRGSLIDRGIANTSSWSKSRGLSPTVIGYSQEESNSCQQSANTLEVLNEYSDKNVLSYGYRVNWRV